MSVLSPALATSSGAPWAHPLTPLESALTDCCLSYKQNAPVSPLESALTNASHLLESAYFETACFDTLAQTSPASPLECALTKTPGVGVPQHPRHPLLAPSHAPRGASIPFGLTRLRILPVTTGVYESVRVLSFCVSRAQHVERGWLASHNLWPRLLVATQTRVPRPAPKSSLCSPCLRGKSIAFILLQTLCRRQKSQALCNQANPASFCKTPGVALSITKTRPSKDCG